MLTITQANENIQRGLLNINICEALQCCVRYNYDQLFSVGSVNCGSVQQSWKTLAHNGIKLAERSNLVVSRSLRDPAEAPSKVRECFR